MRFICHAHYHAMLSSKAEGVVKVLKRSFLSFKQPNVDYMHLCCLLNGIMCVLNTRQISLHRSQALHSPLNLVAAHNPMFACSKPVKTYHIMKPCDDVRMQNDTFVRRQLQHHATKLLNLYTKYLLKSYHKNLETKPQNFTLENELQMYPFYSMQNPLAQNTPMIYFGLQ